MMIATTLVIISLIGSQCFSNVHGAPASSDGTSLSGLCGGESINRLTAGQVISFADQLEGGHTQCPPSVRAALADLAKILTDHSQDVCTVRNMRSIIDFHNEHLKDRPHGSIPHPLEEFALSYAMRTSQSCKLNLIKVFTSEAENKLTPEDFRALSQWTGKDGDIGRLLSMILEPGEIVLPSDMAAILPEEEMIGKLVVKSSSSSVDEEIRHIKETCSRRFKPVYEPVVEPLAILSRAGFDYPDAAIRGALDISAEDAERLDEWARIVFLCETMDFVKSLRRDDEKRSEDSLVFVDSPETLAEQDENIEGASAGASVESAVSLKDVEPLPVDQLGELKERLELHETDRFKLKLAKSQRRIMQKLYGAGEPMEGHLQKSAPLTRRLAGSIQQKDGKINWGKFLMRLGLTAVIIAAIVKMPLTI